ncbi:hypothetical protein V1279_004229 [Bradyrhizobium sp. AZCC 1610]|uniref:hypothetical protein n=1 Tax=Bradyrhizobium sp. AZCC 1610 TaxID=3117020 RepID=UPI002FEF8BB3
MTVCTEKHHANHTHKHGPDCGHTAIRHEGHVDYLHDGHLHHMHEDHVDEHAIGVTATNPVQCTPQVHCEHAHGPNCGHEAVPHGDHIDYLVDGRLHPTIRTVTIAMITGPCNWPEGVDQSRSSSYALDAAALQARMLGGLRREAVI